MSRYPAMRGPVEDGQVLKVAPGATYKTSPSSTGPLSLDSVTKNHPFKKKTWKKQRLCWKVEEKRMEGDDPEAGDASSSRYSGEVSEEIRRKGRDMNS